MEHVFFKLSLFTGIVRKVKRFSLGSTVLTTAYSLARQLTDIVPHSIAMILIKVAIAAFIDQHVFSAIGSTRSWTCHLRLDRSFPDSNQPPHVSFDSYISSL